MARAVQTAPPDDSDSVTARTLQHYNQRALQFREGTREHDVRQNIDALLTSIRATAPLTILDFGCGPGRDLRAFTRLGHVAIGLEGAASSSSMARAGSGCEVWQQDFAEAASAVRALRRGVRECITVSCARAALPRVLRELHATLKPGGVLFSSNPRGENEEGWNAAATAAITTWRVAALLIAAGFAELDHYYRPAGLPREQQPWLASVWRK